MQELAISTQVTAKLPEVRPTGCHGDYSYDFCSLSLGAGSRSYSGKKSTEAPGNGWNSTSINRLPFFTGIPPARGGQTTRIITGAQTLRQQSFKEPQILVRL